MANRQFAHNLKTQCAMKYGPRRSTQANENGVFSFSDVQPGRYEIWSSRYSIGISQKQWIEVGEE
ncbi:MAG: carboxypeptidase-like regulatory domain-containing protein, partial [bacterium]